MVKLKAGVVFICALVMIFGGLAVATSAETETSDDTPTDKDLAMFTNDKAAFIDRLLTVIEQDIVPLTQKGVWRGCHQKERSIYGGSRDQLGDRQSADAR